jgi:hypothetical protein
MSPSSSADLPSTEPLQRLVTRVERRVRLQEGLERATTGALSALMLGLIVLTLAKTGWLAVDTLVAGLLVLGAIPVGGFVSAWFGPRDSVELAQRIDHAHDLHDRLSTALSFTRGGQPASDRFARAQIEDALAHADSVDVQRAVPLEMPRDLRMLGGFAAAFGFLWMVSPPSHQHPLPEPPEIKHDPILDDATIAMEKEEIERMKEKLEGTDDPEAEEVVREIEELVEDAEKRRISGREFLERVEKIEKKHFPDEGPNEPSMAEDLKKAAESVEKEMGEELKKDESAQKAVEAMKNKDLDEASKALEKMAEEMKSDEKTNPERMKRLSKLMKKFAENLDRDKLRKMAEKHEKLARKLAQKMQNQGGLSNEEKRRLEQAKKKADDLREELGSNGGSGSSKRQRQLKRLQRKTEQASEQLKKAAKQRQKQQGSSQSNDEKKNEPDYRNQASKSMKQASKDVQKGQKQQQSKEVEKMARKQLEQLRESIKRSRPGGGQKRRAQKGSQQGSSGEKMKDYLKRAKGESGESSKRQGQQSGQKGAQKKRDGSKGRQGKESTGRSSDSKSGRRADNRKNGSSQSKGSGSNQSNKSSSQAGDGAGKKALGDKTSLDDTKRKDSHVEGRQGKGPSKSQVIKTASQKGFATREYKDVYSDYSSVAEEVMEREDVPRGYRYYVKRYFELIKPRQQSSSSAD